MASFRSQLLASNEIPVGDSAYFRLIKRSFSQLQVLLPGESNAPNTVSGKTGTPNPVSLSGDNGLVTVTVNAVDATWHLVSVSGDSVTLTSTDPLFVPAGTGTITNGSAQVTVQFGSTSPPTYTVTATDTTNTNIPAATSSPITVNP